jgi:hypothetical protein
MESVFFSPNLIELSIFCSIDYHKHGSGRGNDETAHLRGM